MRRLGPWLRVLGTLLCVILVFRWADPTRVYARLASAPWWAWVGPAVLLMGNAALHALRIRALLPAPRPPWTRLLRAIYLGSFFGLALPTGGAEAARLVVIRREVGALDTALAAMGTARLLELGVWALLCIYGAVVVLPTGWAWLGPLAWSAALGMLTVLGAGLAILRAGPKLVPRLPARIRPFAARLAGLGASPGALLRSAALVVPTALANVAVVWVACAGQGVELPYTTLLGLVPTLDVVIALPLTIAGVGVREGVFQAALAARGVAPEVATAIALTRWSGDLARAAIGAVLLVTAPAIVRRGPVTGGD